MKDSYLQSQLHQERNAPENRVALSIIVVSYNTRQMTLDCLESIYRETTTPFEIIVVDNASTDGSAQAISQAFPNVRLIAENENHGFAPAHDIALQYCTGNWLLLLNPDTVILDGAVDRLMAFARRTPAAKIWGGRTIFQDGTLNRTSCWRRMSFWTVFCRVTGLTGLFPRSEIFNAEEYGGWPRDTERNVDIVTGCFFLLERKTWTALGGFDPTFKMYGEEADLCLRARLALDARPRITPDATIIHHGGASEKVPAERIIRVLRAKSELIHRHFSAVTRGPGRLLFMFFPLSRWMANLIAGKLLRRDGLIKNAEIWREVWIRRNEWITGFARN